MKIFSAQAGFLLLAVFSFQITAMAAEITVAAASSLSNAFKDIGAAFEARKTNVKVHFNFGASGALLQQLRAGAPLDVFAAADQETMSQAEQQGLVVANETKNFALNELVLIVPLTSSLTFQGLQDLSNRSVSRIALGNPASVPAGRYAKQALELSKLWLPLQKSLITTQNVRQSLDYVARSEVDAGFVYATDALLLNDKVKVAMKVPLETRVEYPLSVCKDAKNLLLAKDFVSFVVSNEGQGILAKYGFGKP